MKPDGKGAAGRGLPDHDDPEVDEILAAFHRAPRAPGAGVALSELVSEPTPRAPELAERDGATYVLPRTRDRQRRRRAGVTAAAWVVACLALAGALWLALRPPGRSLSAPKGSDSREAPNSDQGAGTGGATRASPLSAPGLPPPGRSASVEAPSGRPSAKAIDSQGESAGVLPARRPTAVPPASSSGDVPGAAHHLPAPSTAGSNLDPEYKRSM
jgi:hypothetical protein